MTMAQLTLPWALNPATTFETLVAGANEVLVARLKHIIHTAGFNIIYAWGPHGSGRSHLLQACCHAQHAAQGAPIYVDLAEHARLSVDVLSGLEQTRLVCLDNIDHIAGNADWEAAVFHCYNRCQAAGVPWLVTALQPPMQLACVLPDLRTRLGAGEVYTIHPLQDQEKCLALQKHCAILGLSLSMEVAIYWLRHGAREMHALMRDLKALDQASWQKQRALTVPFLKSVLGW